MRRELLIVFGTLLLISCGGSSTDNSAQAAPTIQDSDGDGIPDETDVFPNDASEWLDSDGDGVGDNADVFPSDVNEWLDSDGDGVGDNADVFPNNAEEWLDSDGDNVGDNSDAFPNDETEWLDSDGDSVGDNSDVFPEDGQEWLDSDADGVGDNADAFPNDPTRWLAAVELSPQLPDVLFNYANIALPEHYTRDDFPEDAQAQRAAIELDNTPEDNPITDAGATLGRVLFYDKKLSANGTVACASCHQQSHGFSDPQTLSTGFDGGKTRRHAMGLANARFYISGKFFWDERAATLEQQALMPFQDPIEMGLTLEELEAIVSSQSYYPSLFEAAFGDNQVTSERIAKALAQFQRSIVSTSSRYDIARGEALSPNEDFPSFTRQENRGKRLFFGPRTNENGDTANCAGCHISEAFVGPVAAGPQGTTTATNNGLDAQSTDDLGIFETTNNANDIGKFKAPSLINIAARPPYMHDGRFENLEQVIDFYSTDIQNHENLRAPLQGSNGESFQFNFTEDEKAALIAFLETLTDQEMLSDEKYADPFSSDEN